jgi:hypothetical protein
MRFLNGDFENKRNVYNLYSITIAVQDGKSAPDDEFASIETAASGNNPSREKRLYLPAEPPPPTRGEGAVTVLSGSSAFRLACPHFTTKLQTPSSTPASRGVN